MKWFFYTNMIAGFMCIYAGDAWREKSRAVYAALNFLGLINVIIFAMAAVGVWPE